MPNNRTKIVVTGLGVVSPIGIGKEGFWAPLKRGTSGISQVSLFETYGLSCHQAGEIVNFNAAEFLGQKGLKYLDRATQLTGVAAALALADAGLPISRTEEMEIGLVLGTTFGSIESIMGFDRLSLEEGPKNVHPMDFPKTVINSPAGHTAIKFGLTGINSTISTGTVSSLQSINYAADYLVKEPAGVLLAGGTEELCLPGYIAALKMRVLSGSADESTERMAPFDLGRNGFILGEGAVLFVLETLEHALARHAKIYGEIIGFGSAHDAHRTDGYHLDGTGATRAMNMALQEAELFPSQVDLLCASANGSPMGDEMEARAINNVFQKLTPALAITAVKSLVGESLGAAGAFQIAAGILALTDGVVAPTMNVNACDPDWHLDGLVTEILEREVKTAMINSFGIDGNNASMILGRID